MRMPRASRTAGWSSTIRTRAGGAGGRLALRGMQGLLGQSACYHGPAVFGAPNRQTGTQKRGPVPHDANPQPGFAPVGEAGAVVAGGEYDLAVPRVEADLNVFGAPVAQRVRAGLLGDVIQVRPLAPA